VIGKPARDWLMTRLRIKTNRDPNNPIWRTWERFGVAGFGLLAPMLVGAQGGAIIGLALGVPPRRLTVWMTLGGVLWAVIITVIVVAGVLGTRAIK
jgi:hypothetical protein